MLPSSIKANLAHKAISKPGVETALDAVKNATSRAPLFFCGGPYSEEAIRNDLLLCWHLNQGIQLKTRTFNMAFNRVQLRG
ncbi:MAG: hypothetical protein DSO08_05100 [Candidatus Methanomethylicota archaeon]|uniref:Uncharacterized protein n=1 Tax=Thermoproteota archaeon TaxID=2056631 RepID=A0A523BA74_9CREN|nr:MAG: hypothetical protein DSO08_05100 [Candidatus Verstraetearchaeota archaeon]